MNKQTKSEIVAADITALLRARNPLIWIVTREEARAERYLIEAAVAAQYVPRTWDVAQGICNLSGKIDIQGCQEPDAALEQIRMRATGEVGLAQRGVWIMRDLGVWLSGPMGAAPQRRLRNLARMLPGIELDRAQAVIVISAGGDIPPELMGHATVIDWPLPDREEIAGILDVTLEALPDDYKAKAAPNGTREAAIDAAVGMTGEEAAACYARSLVQLKRIDPAAVANEKKRIIARERVLEWHDPLPGGLDMVGGLENLKAWLLKRNEHYTPAARAYGLPAPKGVVLAGVSGCGKTMTAKAVSTAFGVPLLRLDMGSLKSKFVGESEGNLRKALKVIEAIGRCVVLLDEIEKSMQGATSGSADGGVSADALGAVLTWMQERQGEAFVIATANDVSVLPPELLRKGRFDELWFVDLPNDDERKAVLSSAMRERGRDPATLNVDMAIMSRATDGFTGAEIAALVPDAMSDAFTDGGREINTQDLVTAAATVVPLSRTADKKIEALRAWANGRARPASVEQKKVEPAKKRVLDIVS